MMRRVACPAPVTSTTVVAAFLASHARLLRQTTLSETLKPIPGQGAGTLNVVNEVCVNPDADEERKRPIFRSEVFPKRPEHHWLATMWKWGYNSMSLYKKVNEDPGPWWNANCATNTSNWSQVGDYACAGLWSGVWRYTYGVGHYNLRPGELRDRAHGRRDAKGAVCVDYQETIKAPTQFFTMPHTKEHEQHKRLKNPELPGFKTIDAIHGKRVLREVQYHLGHGLRLFLVDGVFGSHPEICTPYRIITDNANHAYLASIAAIRNCNITAYEEVLLQKRLNSSPMDEWSWRRPPVLVLHAPCYDFEAPRIVEEFGGPRPQDLSLESPKFAVVDPYSIPMKGVVGGDPKASLLLDTVGFLCARWGYYADDRNFLTLPSDSVLSADGKTLTVFVSNGAVDVNALRASSNLYGAFTHRIANGLVSRAWDSTSVSSKNAPTHEMDFVEESHGLIHRPLPSFLRQPESKSHRFWSNRRRMNEYGYKLPHNHLAKPEDRAAAAGLLFGKSGSDAVPRPAAMTTRTTNFVIVSGEGKLADATAEVGAKAIVDGMTASSWLYADAAALTATFKQHLERAASVKTIGKAEAAAYVASLAK